VPRRVDAGVHLTRCFEAEIHESMQDLVEQAKAEQVKRIKGRESKER
jgi:hypothetical protein